MHTFYSRAKALAATILYMVPLILGFQSCVPLASSSQGYGAGYGNASGKTLRYENAAYEEFIATVQLYRDDNLALHPSTQPAVIPIERPYPLILEFDYLWGQAEDFRARLIHCNANWRPSNLSPLEYLNEYNEFLLPTPQTSFNTRLPYMHYTFEVPPVKLSGNYLLVVQRGGNEDDIILSRRFMVYERGAGIAAQVIRSADLKRRLTHQQVEFEVKYSGALNITNPYTEIKVAVRQNQQWQSLVTNIQPSMVNESQQTLEYAPLDLSNNFPGGNEYRFFDLGSFNAGGAFVDRFMVAPDRLEAFVAPQKSRKGQAYSQLQDINGQYYVETRDQGGNAIGAEYAYTHFYLETEPLLRGDIYVQGAFNDWQADSTSRMVYNPVNKQYEKTLLLKQGWYNFRFGTQDEVLPEGYHEGNHVNAENQYEIFVYAKPFDARADRLVGYTVLTGQPF